MEKHSSIYPKKSLEVSLKASLIKILLVTMFGLYCNPTYADNASVTQKLVVTGVVSGTEGETLSGVSISEKGTTNGTVSDLDGKFSLGIQSTSSVLVFSFIGKTTVERSVGTQRDFNITMEDDARFLDEVVVIGYGTQNKKDLTGAVGSIHDALSKML